MSIASSLVGEDAKTKFLSKMGQLTTSGAMLANVFQRKKWSYRWPINGWDQLTGPHLSVHVTGRKRKKKLQVEEECRWFSFKKWRFAERFWFKISSAGGLEVFPLAYFSSPLLKRKHKTSVFTDLGVAFVNQCCQRYHFRRKKGEHERKTNTLDSIEPPKTRTREVIPDCFLTWKCHRLNFHSPQYF